MFSALPGFQNPGRVFDLRQNYDKPVTRARQRNAILETQEKTLQTLSLTHLPVGDGQTERIEDRGRETVGG